MNKGIPSPKMIYKIDNISYSKGGLFFLRIAITMISAHLKDKKRKKMINCT